MTCSSDNCLENGLLTMKPCSLKNLGHSRLSDRVEWDFNPPARHNKNCTVNTCLCPVLQILRPVGHRVNQTDLYNKASQFRHGAFIFHRRQELIRKSSACSTNRIQSSLTAVRQIYRDLSGTGGDKIDRPPARLGNEQKVSSPNHLTLSHAFAENNARGFNAS